MTSRRTALLLAGAAVLAAGPAGAQGLEGSLLSTTLSQRFEADTNYSLADPSPGTSYFTDTRLGLGLLSETPTGALTLGFDTGLRAFWPADESFDFSVASPTTASAGYTTEWSRGSFEAGARYRQTRVSFDRPLDTVLGIDPLTGAPLPAGGGAGDGETPVDEAGGPLTGDGLGILPDNINQLTGDTIERRYDADVTLALAQDAPSSYDFSLDATRFDYSDTGTNRVPRTTVRGTAGWTFRLTPVLSSAVVARYYNYSADNARQTRIREAEIDAGVIYQVSEVLRLTTGLGYVDRNRKETRGGGRLDVNDGSGPAIRAGARYDLRAFRLDADTRIFAASPDTRLTGNLRVSYPLERSRVNARVFRRYIGNSNGDEVRLTGASIGVERELNRVSRIGVDFSAANQVNQDIPTDPEVRRLDASATFSRAITAVVTADVGYRFRALDESPDSATSHAVFFEIGRSFDTRF